MEFRVINIFRTCGFILKVLVAQSCLILCNPMDCSLPGYSVHGILHARILEWIPLPSSGYLPDPEIESMSLASPAMMGRQILYH